MSKTDKLLTALKENINNWTCGYCSSGSNQPAATFRELKKQGYSFEEVLPNRWGKALFCSVCNAARTHYKLLLPEPAFEVRNRFSISPSERKRALLVLGERDAFSGATITSTPEIDHKIPWTRLSDEVKIDELDNRQIKEKFQLLTREHNLLKDRICQSCIQTNLRPPFFGVKFWYEGDNLYQNTCVGCGWYDAVKWKEKLNTVLCQN